MNMGERLTQRRWKVNSKLKHGGRVRGKRRV
jgi:hypothetical protein